MQAEIEKLKFHNKALLMMMQDVMNGVSVQHSEHFAIIMFDLSKQDYRQIVDWIGEYCGDIVNFCEKISQLKTEISGQLSVQLMIQEQDVI